MSNRQGAQERSRDETACGERASARPLTAPSTVASLAKVRAIQQRSGEFYSGTFEEFSTGIDNPSRGQPTPASLLVDALRYRSDRSRQA